MPTLLYQPDIKTFWPALRCLLLLFYGTVVMLVLPGQANAIASNPCPTCTEERYTVWNGVSLGGYTSAVSVVQGGALNFHISTDRTTYDLKIYREGTNRQLMTTITGLTGAFYSCTDGYETGCNWPVAYTLTVPATWSSGIYTADIPTSAGTRSLIFWVREDTPGSTSKMLFLSSTLTYQAYNVFGGKSLYDSDSSNSQRSYKVSFDRPYEKSGGVGDFSKWEAYFVQWAEAEAYHLEYATTYDLAFIPNLLDCYEVIVIAGHSEYYSWDMRQRIRAFVNGGGRLVNLSGNTMWWQVRFENNGRTLVEYKDYNLDPATTPQEETDNNWDHPIYDAENVITGASFRKGGYINDNGKYLYADGYGGYWVNQAQHWIFAGTGLSNGTIFGRTASSSTAIAGYEVDGTLFNCTPDGQTIATPLGTDGTPNNFTILAAAPSTSGFGVIGIYTSPEGGAVFSGNTINWARGLAVDSNVATITKNVLNRFLTHNFPQEPIQPDTAYYFYDRFNCNGLIYGGKIKHNYDYAVNDAGAYYSPTCGIGQGSGLQVDIDDQQTVILKTPIRPNFQSADVLYNRLYVDISRLTMSDNNEFDILRWQHDPRSSSGAMLASLKIRQVAGKPFIRYQVAAPYWGGPSDVEIPTNRPFIVETLWDKPNNLVSLWVDNVRYDRTFNLSTMLPLNAVSLMLYGVDTGTLGTLCYDEFAVDDQRIGPLPPPNASPQFELSGGYVAQVQAGKVMTFTHNLTNTGLTPDRFNVAATIDRVGWTAVVSPAIVGPLTTGQKGEIQIVVSVPPTEVGNTIGSIQVVASSQISNTVSKTAIDTLTVLPKLPHLQLSPGYADQVHAGEVLTFTHIFTNTGEMSGSFYLTATPNLPSWTAVVSPSLVGPLNAGQNGEVRVVVSVPLNEISNITGSVQVTATSQISDTISTCVIDTLTVLPMSNNEGLKIYLPVILRLLE